MYVQENDKASLRVRIKKLLSEMSQADKKKADVVICKTVLLLPELIQSKTICIYHSFGTEVDTKQLITKLRAMGKIVVAPEETGKKTIDCFIVPGIAFDRKLHRLGRGGGYYDKLLTRVTAAKIGLAYAIQVIAEVPHTSYDVSMTALITEGGS